MAFGSAGLVAATKARSADVFDGHSDKITSIDTTPDGAFLCSSSRDGTTRFWHPDTGRELARFIGFSDGEWIVITPEGYFNALPSGAKYLNVRAGGQVCSIDNFYEKYYIPAYVAAVLQGKKVAPAEDIRQGVALPPRVAIVAPATAAEFKNDEVQVAVSAEDMGGGIDEIRLYHNGKAAGTGETVTVRKLMGYLEEELPALTQKYRQEAQYPVVDSKGMDFPLVKSR